MIKRLKLSNLKGIGNQEYEFTNFNLLVGMNNSGKSTILQGMAIWQYCVDEFHRSKKSGVKGIQIVLPNFTALPLPEFNLLWRGKVDRQFSRADGKSKQEFIYIEIVLTWVDRQGKEEEFGVSLRYQSPQSVYVTPIGGWARFNELDASSRLPKLVYIPPFSGLEPFEEWRDDSILKKQIGKAQPGSVLRNLLYRVVDKNRKIVDGDSQRLSPFRNDWQEIQNIIARLFSVDLQPPVYEKGVDTQISCNYKQNKKKYDIISGGSGFHQMLTILAFIYGYPEVTTILFDEPDAHLHVNLQREMLDFLKQQSVTRHLQFITATHAEELIKLVNATEIISLLKGKPEKTIATPAIIVAMSEVSNIEITHVRESPFILYHEGDSDLRILKNWAKVLGKQDLLGKFYFKVMGGGTKEKMKEAAESHFRGLRQIVPLVQRMILFDFDSESSSLNPGKDNLHLYEWKRKNIENYLLVEDAWVRTGERAISNSLFLSQIRNRIKEFFAAQNLTLPPNAAWKSLSTEVFKVVDGKKLLFENENSLFQQLRALELPLDFNKETIADHMKEEELHQDIEDFFFKLERLVNIDQPKSQGQRE